MGNSSRTVEALKKVSLLITAGTTAEMTDLIATPRTLEFIFGIGSGGLVGFEYALVGKKEGDKGIITFEERNRAEVFGHILPCELQSRLAANPCYVQYEICGISDPAPREIVRSIASAAAGCGGGCDCGCGGH